MNALDAFHEGFGYVVIVANGGAGAVGVAAWLLPRLRGRWLWIFTIAAEVAILVEVIVGVILFAATDATADRLRFHMFYGFLMFLTVGLAYQYRDSLQGRLEMFYGLVGLFIMGLGIRAVFEVSS
ncbi:MAG TPA: hypothetical protein VF152_16410 [Acidimicrobiia bacterium]